MLQIVNTMHGQLRHFKLCRLERCGGGWPGPCRARKPRDPL